MSQMHTKYLGQLRTEGKHLKSGNVLLTDPPLDNHGKGEAYSPTDLVAAALSACMMTIMGIVANREQINIEGLESNVVKVMAEHPRRITEIKIEMFMPSSINLSDKNKELLKRAALTCPVAMSLHPDLKQTISFNF